MDAIAFADIEDRYASLTLRERQVLYFVCRGLMSKQAAGLLGLSVITVKVHRAKMMRKMHCRRFVDLIRAADRLDVGVSPIVFDQKRFDRTVDKISWQDSR